MKSISKLQYIFFIIIRYLKGVSTGNASIFTQIIMFVIALFLGQYLKYFEDYKSGFGDGEEVEKLREMRESTRSRARVARASHQASSFGFNRKDPDDDGDENQLELQELSELQSPARMNSCKFEVDESLNEVKGAIFTEFNKLRVIIEKLFHYLTTYLN